jgi:hypothetical protein
MDRAAGEMIDQVEIIRRGVDMIDQARTRSEVLAQLSALREALVRMHDLLTVARNSHYVALDDLPFLRGLFEDIEPRTMAKAVRQAGPKVMVKFFYSCLFLLVVELGAGRKFLREEDRDDYS